MLIILVKVLQPLFVISQCGALSGSLECLPRYRIVWIGWRRSLTYDDLYDLNDEDKSEVVSGRFIKEWEKELKKAK